MTSRARTPHAAAIVAVAALLTAGCGAPSLGSPTSSASENRASLEWVEFPAPSLEGNLLGDPAARGAWVYLPPQYFETDEPMRTVYWLPNYGDLIIHNTNAAEAFDPVFAAETYGPMIVVVIHGENRYNGGFYVDSIVSGDWGEVVARDAVDYVDSHYRTIDSPESRGIAGHAAGGFGALDIALRHPDVFGAAYAFDPWVAAAGDPIDILSRPSYRAETTLDILDDVAGASAAETLARYDKEPVNIGSTQTAIDLAYGMAFAPLPEPPYFEYPLARDPTGGFVVDQRVWARWAPEPGGRPHGDMSAWAALCAIAIDCASNHENEWIPNGCVYLDAELTAAGIDHAFYPDDGVPADHIPTRVVNPMLGFFDDVLVRAGDDA